MGPVSMGIEHVFRLIEFVYLLFINLVELYAFYNNDNQLFIIIQVLKSQPSATSHMNYY